MGVGDRPSVANNDCGDLHRQQGRVGPDGAEPFGGKAGIAGFFKQLANPGRAGVLARLEQSARGLEAVTLRAGAKLANQHNMLVRSNRHDMNSIGEIGDVIIVGLAARGATGTARGEAGTTSFRSVFHRGHRRRR